MYKRTFLTAVCALASACSLANAQPRPEVSKDLRIISVDAEGGAAVLFVTPEGKSLLIDTGWAPGLSGNGQATGVPSAAPISSSADRIAAAAASLGVKKIDYLLITHFHADHFGGLRALLAKMPVGAIIDHGPNREEILPGTAPADIAIAPATIYPRLHPLYQGHDHILARTGEKLNIGSMQLQFVTSDGRILDSPLPGAGQPNPSCSGVPGMEANGGEENVRSIGVLITFGKTRILDLGDLTWNKEIELLCPVNKVGKVDIYFVTGHGMDISSSPPTAALAPIVAIMQNGAEKGGDKAVFKTVKAYPGLEGLWLTHFSVRYPDLNGDPNFIANLPQPTDQGYPIDLELTPEGHITVTNPRTHFSRTYTARGASQR